nr:unnamed protein product [Naegleria fowleri]
MTEQQQQHPVESTSTAPVQVVVITDSEVPSSHSQQQQQPPQPQPNDHDHEQHIDHHHHYQQQQQQENIMSPLADLLSQLYIYNWSEFSKTFSRFTRSTSSSRHNSTLTSSSIYSSTHQQQAHQQQQETQGHHGNSGVDSPQVPQIAILTTSRSQNGSCHITISPSSMSVSSPHSPQQHQPHSHHYLPTTTPPPLPPPSHNHHQNTNNTNNGIQSSPSSVPAADASSDGMTSKINHTTTNMMNLSLLSQHYTLLLVIRRYVRHGGCGFCNRRTVELSEWYKGLLQLHIIPVILHAESEEEGNEFFAHFKSPIVANIPRVSDPRYKRVVKLLEMAGPDVATPLRFEELSFRKKLKTIRPYLSATKQGFTFVENPNQVEYSEGSNLLVPKMVLIRDCEIKYVWDQEIYDHAPDILSTVVLKLPWLAMTSADLSSVNGGGDASSTFRASFSTTVSGHHPTMDQLYEMKTNQTNRMHSRGQTNAISPQHLQVHTMSQNQQHQVQQISHENSRKISSASNSGGGIEVDLNHGHTLSSSYQHTRNLSESFTAISSSHQNQSQFLKQQSQQPQHSRNGSLDPNTALHASGSGQHQPPLDAFDLTRRKISNGQNALSQSTGSFNNNYLSIQDMNTTVHTQLPSSSATSRKQSSTSGGKISPRQRHDLQFYLDQMSSSKVIAAQDRTGSGNNSKSSTPRGGVHSRQHSQVSGGVLAELDAFTITVGDATVDEMNAFGVVQENDKTKLIPPVDSNKNVHDQEELLIEGIEPQLYIPPMSAVGIHNDLPQPQPQQQQPPHHLENLLNRRHSPRQQPSHTPSQSEENYQIRSSQHVDPLQNFTLIRSVPIYRKVEGVLDFELVSKEQLAQEQRQAALQAKQRMKKQTFIIPCMHVEESEEDTESELSTVKVGLQAILNDDHKRQYFKIFALKEFNAENIMFWEDVVSFKKLFIELKEFSDEVTQPDDNRNRVSKLAGVIADKYLFDDYSIYNINTSNTLKQKVSTMILNPNYFYSDDCKFLFDDIILEIMTTVLPDMYHRFLVSNEYKEMLKSSKYFHRGKKK